MKLIPKPEGYDLRTRRAYKQESCEKWEPRDALYEAADLMKGKDVDACVVIWRVKDGPDSYRVLGRRAGNADLTARITMQKAGHYMGWAD